ncbi:ATP synthase H chain mitochondrial precursor [Xylogone sp. PMI_703]|nr:ATP synthase H chain mitochondrial precursor [Xylogone sp. PMI_703]
MLAQSFRASRSSIARIARQQVVAKRTFITPTAVRQADLIQELYLRELKAYKAPAVKPTDAEGHVQVFTPPKTPKSPEETDIASELQAYEASAVEVEGQPEAGAAVEAEHDWFEEEPEEETAHH